MAETQLVTRRGTASVQTVTTVEKMGFCPTVFSCPYFKKRHAYSLKVTVQNTHFPSSTVESPILSFLMDILSFTYIIEKH